MEQGIYKEFVRNWKVEGGRREQKAESREQSTKISSCPSCSCLWNIRFLQERAAQNLEGNTEIDAE
jgi:hypothetical protein